MNALPRAGHQAESVSLKVDGEQIAQFYSALFKSADQGSFISLRAFDQFDRRKPPALAKGVQIGVDHNRTIQTAVRAAQATEDSGAVAVFAPPICTFTNGRRARGVDLCNGLTLSVEVDESPSSARVRLEGLLGPATVVVESGSVWDDPRTGEVQPKLHLHWRLNKPTRTLGEAVELHHARDLAARLAGGDPTGAPVVHPLRWPGTWNRKAAPRMARIVAHSPSIEIHLADALDILAESLGVQAEPSSPTQNGSPEADPGLIADAMHAIPNNDAHYDEWIRLGYAVWRATGGSNEGQSIWNEWSLRSDKYDSGEQDSAWSRIDAAVRGTIPPRRIGAGTIFWLARQHGWRRPVGANGGPPLGFTIHVRAGTVPAQATEGEEALLASGLPVFQRGGALVRPFRREVPASCGRTTIAAGLREIGGPAMIDLLAQAAEWTTWNARAKAEVACNPPKIVADVILSRSGSWTFPVFAGVITTPTLRPDGSLLTAAGYDPPTRLYHVEDPSLILPAMACRETREDAARALDLLDSLLDGFPFASPTDRAVALSALITPVVRGAMTVAPLHAVRATTAGTGKSFLVDVASAISTGRPCPVVAAGATDEETEKRLVALILAGFPVIAIDNVNGELGGDLLCQAVERPLVRVRPLGKSEIVEIESRSTIFATGNALRVRGDMTRRTVVCDLDANMERPETRSFPFDPVERVLADRGPYVAAALTVVRAYHHAGRPGLLRPIASFADWSNWVRSALVWLGRVDPAASMEAAREDDPELTELREMLTLWQKHIGDGVRKTASEVAMSAALRLDSTMESGGEAESAAAELHDALIRIAGERGTISTKRLGKWLLKHEGRIVGARRFKRDGVAHGGAIAWTVQVV